MTRWTLADAVRRDTEAGELDAAAPEMGIGQIPALRDRHALLALLREMREALDAYVRAQGNMLSGWAEGDELVKQDLWRKLHACEEPARSLLDRTAALEDRDE